jgi:hypothetical protein
MRRALGLLAFASLLSCAKIDAGRKGGGRDLGGLSLGGQDGAAGDLMSVDDAALMSMPDLAGLEAGNAYGDALTVDRDASGCAPGQTGTACGNKKPDNAGCGGVEDCGPTGHGNGLDDNCDGKVDEGCPCSPGDVERCFPGPPGKHGVGACTDGTQTCIGSAEFGGWGDCVGAITPKAEVCNMLDDDCNGCVDDGLCCAGGILCPAPGDPRIAAIPPYTDKQYMGAQFFAGAVSTWSWKVSGGPCDRLFASSAFTPQQTPPPQSFTVTGANTANPTLHFTLSGDYTVTLTVVDTSGHSYTCTWVQHVQGPGVRFELCWDHQGTAAQNGADLDLHVHRSGTTTTWSMVTQNVWYGTITSVNTDDCSYLDCTVGTYVSGSGYPNWGYAQTPLSNCSGAKNGNQWVNTAGKDCYNPRLDNDNIDALGVAENTNVDKPKNGDTLRAMVHYYGQGDGAGYSNPNSKNIEEHPIVNVYCGGNLVATYGQAPNQLSGFNQGWGDPTLGYMWRVADVTAQVDGSGNTTGCTVKAIHPPSMNTGFYVTKDNTAY